MDIDQSSNDLLLIERSPHRSNDQYGVVGQKVTVVEAKKKHSKRSPHRGNDMYGVVGQKVTVVEANKKHFKRHPHRANDE